MIRYIARDKTSRKIIIQKEITLETDNPIAVTPEIPEPPKPQKHKRQASTTQRRKKVKHYELDEEYFYD